MLSYAIRMIKVCMADRLMAKNEKDVDYIADVSKDKGYTSFINELNVQQKGTIQMLMSLNGRQGADLYTKYMMGRKAVLNVIIS